jgi:hypothetical protein
VAAEAHDEEQATTVLVGVVGEPHVRGRAAPVRNLADQIALPDQAQRHRAFAVADGVGDQFADDQFGAVDEVVEMPRGELAADKGAGRGHQRGSSGSVHTATRSSPSTLVRARSSVASSTSRSGATV